MTDNIEQRARDLLNAARGAEYFTEHETRENNCSLEAVCRALEAHDETQAAFDAYRREVSEKARKAIEKLNLITKDNCLRSDYRWQHTNACEAKFAIADLIIPEPVDPLVEALCCIVPHIDAGPGETAAEAVARQLRAALAKIGGKVVFGEGA